MEVLGTLMKVNILTIENSIKTTFTKPKAMPNPFNSVLVFTFNHLARKEIDILALAPRYLKRHAFGN